MIKIAIEQFSVELQLLLDQFNQNIQAAQASLHKIQDAAAEVSKKASEELGKIKGPDIGDQQVGFLEKIGHAAESVAKKLVIAGGIYGGFKLLRTVLAGVVGPAEKVGNAFANLTKGISIATGTVSGIARAFLPAGTALKSTLGVIQSASVNTTAFVGSLQMLRKNEDFRNFANSFVKTFDKVEASAKNFLLRIPGVQTGINLLGKAFQAASSGISNFSTSFAPTGEALKNIGLGIANIAAGAVSLAPGMDKMGATFSLADDAAIGAAAGLQAVGVNAGALTSVAAGLVLSINAVNAAIAITGTIMAGVGERIVKTASAWGLAAGQSSLAFSQLENQLKATAEATEINLGTIDDMQKFLKDLADKTGQSETQLAQLTSTFLSLENSAKLTEPELKALIERTVILGTQMGDLPRVTEAVIGGLNGWTRSLTRMGLLIGKTTDLTKLENEGMQNFNATTTGQAVALQRAAFAHNLTNAIMTGTNARVKTFSENSDNLALALKRAAGAEENFFTRLGDASSKTLAPFVNAFASVLTTLKNLPGPILDTISGIVSLTGTILTVVGTALKWAGAFVLVTQAASIFKSVMSLTLPVVGNLGAGLTALFASFNGVAVPIKSVSGLFKALALAIPTALGMVENALGSLLINILKMPIHFGGLVKALLTTTSAWVSLGSTILGVGKSLLIPGKLSLLVIAFTALGQALVYLNEKYDIIKNITEAVTDLFSGQSIVGNTLSFVFAKFAQSVQVLSLLLVGGLEIGAYLATFALNGLAKVMELTGYLLNFLPSKVGEFGKKLNELGHSADAAATAARDKLGKGIGETSKAFIEAVKRLASMNTGLGETEKAAEDTEKAIKKVEVTVALLKNVLEIASKGIENALKGTTASYDDQIASITRLAETEKNFVTLTIDDEALRAKTIFELESRLRNQTLAIESRNYEESLSILKTLEDARLAEIFEISAKNDEKQEERIKKESEVRQKTIEEELKITDDFRKNVDNQIKKVQDGQSQRIAIIRDTKNKIQAIEREGANVLFDLNLKLLTQEQQQSAIRRDIRIKEAQVAAAAASGDFVKAEAIAGQVSTLINKITGSGNAARAATLTAGLAELGTFDSAAVTLHNKISELAGGLTLEQQNLMAAVSSSVDRFGKGSVEAKAAVDALNTSLIKTEANAATREQISEQERLIDIESQIQEARQANAEQERAKLQDTQKQLEEMFNSLQEKANALRDQLASPIDVLVHFSPETEAVEAAIEELRNREVYITTSFQTSRTVDMEGYSKHDVRDVAGLVAKKFAPAFIPVAFQTAPVPGAAAGVGRIGAASNRVVRVDLNLGGETHSVSVVGERNADSLVKFTQALRSNLRTQGSYVSPLRRNF